MCLVQPQIPLVGGGGSLRVRNVQNANAPSECCDVPFRPFNYTDVTIGFGVPIGPIGVGPQVGFMYDHRTGSGNLAVGGAISFPPGPSASAMRSQDTYTPGTMNYAVTAGAGPGLSMGRDSDGSSYMESGATTPQISVSAMSIIGSHPSAGRNSRPNPNSAANIPRPRSNSPSSNCACNR